MRHLDVTNDLWERPWPELSGEGIVTGDVERVGLTRDATGTATVVALVRLPTGARAFVGIPFGVAVKISRKLRWAPIGIEELGL